LLKRLISAALLIRADIIELVKRAKELGANIEELKEIIV